MKSKLRVLVSKAVLFYLLLLSIISVIHYNNTSMILNRKSLNYNRVPQINGDSEDWYVKFSGPQFDSALAIANDSEGNIYVAGITESYGAGETDFILVKFNKSGVYQWNVTHGGSDKEGFQSTTKIGLAVDSNDDIILVGWTQSWGHGNKDIEIIKYNSSGQKIWNRTWGKNTEDWGFGVAVDASDNIYVVGKQHDGGHPFQYDAVLIKYDANGNEIWNQTWGGLYDNEEVAYDIAINKSSNEIFIVGMYNYSGGETGDILFLKYDTSGNFQTEKHFHGSRVDIGYGICIAPDNNIYIVGISDSFSSGNYNKFIFKLDKNGNQLWNITYSGTIPEYAYNVIADSQNYIYMAGEFYTNSYYDYNFGYIKLDNQSNEIKRITWGFPNTPEKGRDILIDKSGNIYMCGYIYMLTSDADIILVKNPLRGIYTENASNNNDEEENEEESETSTSIPGYNFPLLLGIFSIITVIISIELRKNIK